MAGTFEPAVAMFAQGGASFLKYWWVVAIVLVLGIIAAVVFWISKYKKKNSQWTHKLKCRFEDSLGNIPDYIKTIKMRRWKHEKEITAPLFELESPLLGSRIFVELEEYSGPTEYTIIVGKDGRIYIPTKTTMDRDKNALNVSVKHAAIDRARQSYNTSFEAMNATPKKIDVLALMKLGIYTTLIVVLLILGIQGIKAWGERAPIDQQSIQLELQLMNTQVKVVEDLQSVTNTIALLMPDLKQLKGNNLQGAIINRKSELNNS